MPKRSRWYYEIRWLVRVTFWTAVCLIATATLVSLAVFLTDFVNYVWHGTGR